MNRSPLKQLDIGNMIVSPVLTARKLGYTESLEELTQTLRKFNYRNILITLARINLLLQRSKDFSSDEEILKEAFCPDVWFTTGDLSDLRGFVDLQGLIDLQGHIVFNRQSTLRLLIESTRVSDPNSTYTLDRVDARNGLARCYLIANGMLDEGSSASDTISEEEVDKQMIADSISTGEYAINPSPEYRTKFLTVRSAEFLNRLVNIQDARLEVDANQTFFEATGLTLKDYQHLVFSIFAVYWNCSPQEIIRQDPSRDGSLFFGPSSVPGLAPLYEKFLRHTCISIDVLKERAENFPSFKNEFRLWRQYPLVKVSENQVLCVDFSFLLEKLQSGVFWIIRNQLEKQRHGDGQKIIALWGDIFEDYTASIIKRGIDDQVPRVENYIIAPKYDQGQKEECTDVIIHGDDTLILLECKAPLLRGESKFSGDFDTLYAELKDKIIEGERPGKARGIKQLRNAIQSLFHSDEVQRRSIEGINISNIKKIYPVLILSDRMFSVLCMNWFLNLEFQRLMKDIYREADLDIKPLAVLTMEDLESLEPYLSDIPFHVHLGKWIEWRTEVESNEKLSFSSFLFPLLKEDPRENTFFDQRFNEIRSEMMTYFTDRGVE